MNREAYEAQTALTRDARMAWWRDARFGLFVHYGIYSCYGRGEWVKMREGISHEEYTETLNTEFNYRSGNAEEWVKLAKAAGMKYAVLTTQHHDGFSLWDSKVNPFNSVNYGPHIDIVGEFADACRKHGIKVGLYYSLVNWIHPDGQLCAHDESARVRFVTDIRSRLHELMTGYGKIDILWYDVASPLKTAEEWESVETNAMVRELQPDIIINHRSKLPEDFAIAEDNLTVPKDCTDWEGCMRFSTTAFGGLDHDRALPFALNAHDIVKLLSRCQYGGGNLIFNIAPKADGSVDTYEKQTLETVGKWIARHSEAVYGASTRGSHGANGISTSSRKGNKVCLWNWIWSPVQRINGYKNVPNSIRCLSNGMAVDFEYKDGVLHLLNLPDESPDDILNFTVFEMDFGDDAPRYQLVPPNMVEFMNI